MIAKAGFDYEYNEKNFELLVRSMECAACLGAKIIVVHPIKERSGGHGDTYTKPQKNFESSEERFQVNIDFYNRLLPYCNWSVKIHRMQSEYWVRNV